ncbi:hypothetical protein DFR56_10297 [Pseudogracilibacillus auburnensis]|uniref:Uncharacterized protein n=1 Tax=Pseudogracilibacillus auburnensis TaxID=1494959 RepID=A0A2V3W8L2_9BACI|nr:hypothetical protein DFR56_10297 [Pseudogracilibacillus auburnensis]
MYKKHERNLIVLTLIVALIMLISLVSRTIH